MRIVVDAVAVQGGGGRTYLLNIMEALAASSAAHDYLVVLTPRQRELAELMPAGVRRLVCRSVPSSPWLRVMWEQIVLPHIVRRERADLLFAGFNTAPLYSPAPVVLVAQSVNAYSELPIRWPFRMALRHAGLRWLGRRSASVARRVVFTSHTAARFMAPRMGVIPERVRVIPYGWRPPRVGPRTSEDRPMLPDHYVLTVGDLLDHKNVEILLEAFDILATTTDYSGALVIVGGVQDASPKYASRLETIRRRLRHRDRVRFIGRVAYHDVDVCYRAADLFALPSLEETFGLPLLEALGAGVPVVAADWRLNPAGDNGRTNVGPEVCGQVAEFFDPQDKHSLVDAMRRVLEQPARRSALVRDGPARAAQFSWQRAATELLAVFDEAVSRD
jgi:glycosyltransferase involved in cell wall biosynthesis